MGIFTSLAIAAAVGAGAGAAISNKKKRAASAARNQANAAKTAQPAQPAQPVKKTASVGAPQGSISRPRGQAGKKSQTRYTGTLGLSVGERSGVNLKVLTGA